MHFLYRNYEHLNFDEHGGKGRFHKIVDMTGEFQNSTLVDKIWLFLCEYVIFTQSVQFFPGILTKSHKSVVNNDRLSFATNPLPNSTFSRMAWPHKDS